MMRALSILAIRRARRAGFAAAGALLALAAAAGAQPVAISPADATLDRLYRRAITAPPSARSGASDAFIRALADYTRLGQLASGAAIDHYANRLKAKASEPEAETLQRDHGGRLYARVRLLAAAAYIVDTGAESFKAAAAICRQVEGVAGAGAKAFPASKAQWRALRDRARSLNVVAGCLAGDSPAADAAASELAKAVAALYRPQVADLADAKALIKTARTAVRASERPGGTGSAAERIATEAVAAYLVAVEAILAEPPPADLTSAMTRVNRHAMPAAIRPPLQSRAAQLQQRLTERERVIPLFVEWAHTPNKPALLQKLRAAFDASKHVEADPAMRYSRSIYEAALVDWQHRYQRVDLKQYANNLEYYHKTVARYGPGRPIPVRGVGDTAIVPFVTALLAMQAGDATQMRLLRRAGWALDTELGRATEYYLLADGSARAAADPVLAGALTARATTLCEATARADGADAACLKGYRHLRDTLAGNVTSSIGTRIADYLDGGMIAQALEEYRRWQNRVTLTGEVKVKLLTAAMDAGFATDATLGPLAESLGSLAERHRLGGELYARQEAIVPSEGRAAALQAAMGGDTRPAKPWRRYGSIRALARQPELARTPGAGHLARCVWLQMLLEAGLNERAFGFIRTRHIEHKSPPPVAGLADGVLARNLALTARRMTEAVRSAVDGDDPGRILAARDLLADEEAWPFGAAGAALRQRCYRAVQRLRAREIYRQPTHGEALAAYRDAAFTATPTAWRQGGKIDTDDPAETTWRQAYAKLLAGASTLDDLFALAEDRHVRPPGELFARAAMTMALAELRRPNPEPLATCSLLDAVDQFGPPAPPGPSRYWARTYARLAQLAPADPRRRDWQARAAAYMPADSQLDMSRRATLLAAADDPAGCLAEIRTFRRTYGELTAGLRILGGVCVLRLEWQRGATMGQLAEAVGRWCRGSPAKYLLTGATDLRPRTRARRDLLLAVLTLGADRPSPEAVQRSHDALAAATAAPSVRGSALRLNGAEADIARGLTAAATVALTRDPAVMDRVARQLLPAPAGAADAAFYKARYMALPVALRPTAAAAAYAGGRWHRAAGAYAARLDALDEAVAMGAEELETFRRWLEAEVKRRGGGGDPALRVRLLVQAAADSPHAARFVTAGASRRLAAGRLWGGEPTGSDAAENYARMIARTAAYKLGDAASNEFTAWAALGAATDAPPYVSLWYVVHWYPGRPRDAHRLDDGAAWPAPLRTWVGGAAAAAASKDFRGRVDTWCLAAGLDARDRRAEAWLLRYLLDADHDAGALAEAIGTFAFGNPEYSLAVALWRHRIESQETRTSP